MSPREFVRRRLEGGGCGGMIPAAAVLIVVGALGVFCGSLYVFEPEPGAPTTEQQDLVDQVTRLVRSVERRVWHEKTTVDEAARIGTVLSETLVRESVEEPAKPHTAPEPLAVLKLEGVAWNPDMPLAFVNGGVVAVGDVIHGFEVTEIRQEKIVLKGAGGHPRELLLYGE